MESSAVWQSGNDTHRSGQRIKNDYYEKMHICKKSRSNVEQAKEYSFKKYCISITRKRKLLHFLVVRTLAMEQSNTCSDYRHRGLCVILNQV